jgi:glutathione synthase/RimK-type ligase-like ATP-grasp enzyme
MATVGVLSARARVEEKALMAALADAGIVSALFPPADEPLPIGPLPVTPGGRQFPVPQIVVDRHPNRRIARPVLATCRARGVPALSAGIAATGDRLDVASALDAAGVPRPWTALYTSEQAALRAVATLDFPCTVLPLDMEGPGIALLDVDVAEAVLGEQPVGVVPEHRAVLGSSDGALGLIQAGAPATRDRVVAIVVDGSAVAIIAAAETTTPDYALRMAEDAARALCAEFVGIEIALSESGPLVWDAHPVPEFRHALPIAEFTVAEALAHAVERRLATPLTIELESVLFGERAQEGVRGDVVYSA